MQQYLKIGTVISTHGLKGEVKVYPATDDIRRFDYLDELFVEMKSAAQTKNKNTASGNDPFSRQNIVLTEDGKRLLPLRAERARYFKNLVILKFRGIDRIEGVEGLLKSDLYVSRENAIPLGEDEYFVGDLIGLEVYTDEGRLLGELTDVLETRANNVYVVSSADGSGKEILIPAIDDCILDIDLDEEKMTVHLLPGLE